MADIFGKNPQDYTIYRDMKEAGVWDNYQRDESHKRWSGLPHHDFTALGGGTSPQYHRAGEDASAVGYLTNNLLAIQTAVDEVLYRGYRLPEFISLNTAIPEGASSYGVRVRDRVGEAKRLTAPGYDAPSATTSQTLVTQPIHWYGLDGEWSLDELRGAQFAGIALDTETIDAATTGTMETMQRVGLTGGGYAENGLLNLATSGADSVNHSTASATFEDSTAVQIRSLINGQLSQVIEDSQEAIGSDINTGMTVYLPGKQYDLLTTMYIGDNAQNTVMDSIMRDNPWTHFSGQSLTIVRVLELKGQGASDADRMIVGLKTGRVAEMGVSISPRVLRIIDKGRVICAQVEAKFSSLFVKRPNTLRYIDGI